ncbi:MAG: radical SAM protein [Candidatus Aminicenantes bacterium]|nr:radical SAM protein [Candidatus Aminicenantes bacterium]
MKGEPPKALIYGPVPSRRLGYSLGLDILPFKTCSMDCIYCQLGAYGRTTDRRREYVPVRAVLAQIRGALASGARIDAITFSGSGEPTLHAGIGRIIAGIKRMTDVKVVVLTNSSTLAGRRNGRDLVQADIVVPSLDAVTDRIFAKVNRPHAGLTAEKIIDGLVRFRRRFKGRIWLEVMLVRGINDGPAHLRRLRAAIERIRPDRVQINTVVRPPAEKSARPLTAAELERVRIFLGPTAEIIADFSREKQPVPAPDASAAILAALKRRPMTAGDLSQSLGLVVEEVLALTRRLTVAGAIRKVAHSGNAYFEPAPTSKG